MRVGIMLLITLMMFSCSNSEKDKYKSTWVEKIGNDFRVLIFENINDTTLFLQSAIFDKNFNPKDNKDALDNYFAGVLRTNDGKLLSCSYDIFNDFSLMFSGDNLVLKFNSDYPTNRYFPSHVNKYRTKYPVELTFKERQNLSLIDKFQSISNNLYFETFADASFWKLQDGPKEVPLKWYQYPTLSNAKEIIIDSNAILRYCMINGDYRKGENALHYDSTTYYKMYYYRTSKDVIKNQFKYQGWLKKSDMMVLREVNSLNFE